MPTSLQAKKRVRQNEKNRIRNRSNKSRLHTLVRKLDEFITAKDAEKATTQLKRIIAELDRDVSKGVLHKSTANRRKSRMMLKVNALSKK